MPSAAAAAAAAARDPEEAAAPAHPPTHRLDGLRAVVFDTDGVITDSARVHAAAWKEAFDDCLREWRERGGGQPQKGPRDRFRPFDIREDYRRYVDGRSRLDGAAAFLASRGLDLPPGEPDDPPGNGTVRAVAARKERLFTAALRQDGVQAWPGTLRLLRALRREGVPMAVISASRHARELLSGAGVLEVFDAVVDGHEAARLGLPGKPDPAVFLEAARRLGVAPGEAAVVEDALAGVEAGRRGGFGLVVGVDRTNGPTSARDLREHGADVVVTDLAELLPPGPRTGRHDEEG
ncbi:HAD family hydrolase [Streptomyces pini]|uniref:Haloacid dehalogenase superfamily, subfamily IA, variant 3 with third motif having DD or ED/beta-phosphoglucomutase family hydrolase n=1 Tax=Streptomyces pini TaxID=1520580 RepID=A0A1I3X691_9ACTN|nr:HAD-IA family hydrolase [Streptomyces pini]SFK15342.1 haloacid dehalogenase superfamily, subfamily IA, variant 3 with third motif having DD or ED/beta-phosphoglucomutase family hydrolase [Streptomyces pini]